MSNINNTLSCSSALYKGEQGLELTEDKRAKIGTTYYNQYKWFLCWFDNNVNTPEYALSAEPGGQQYFKHAVCQYVGKEGSANSHFTSLQWVNYHIEAQKGTKLIMSPIIHDAIRQQQTYHKNATKEKYQNVYPHKGLRDLMPLEESLQLFISSHLMLLI
jgi:hypothetical protein